MDFILEHVENDYTNVSPQCDAMIQNNTVNFLGEITHITHEKYSEQYPSKQQVQEIIEKNIGILDNVKFNSHCDLIQCLEFSSSNMLGEKISEHNIEEFTIGKSGDKVFKIEGGNSFIVIKTFQKNNDTNRFHHLYREAISLYNANKLDLKFLIPPKLLGLSVCSFNDCEYALEYQQFLKGMPIGGYIESIKKHELYSANRHHANIKAEKAFFSLGQGIAEFHFINSNDNYEYIPKLIKNFYDDLLKSAIEKIVEFNDIIQIDVADLKNMFSDKFRIMGKVPLKLGFWHIDPNFGNYLIDESEKNWVPKILDMGRTLTSMTKNLEPVALSGLDFYLLTEFYFIMQRDRCLKLGNDYLTNQEIFNLSTSFKNGYISYGGQNNLIYEKDFFTIHQCLFYISVFVKEKYMVAYSKMDTIDDKKKWISIDLVISLLQKKLKEYNNEKYCFDWEYQCPNNKFLRQ